MPAGALISYKAYSRLIISNTLSENLSFAGVRRTVHLLKFLPIPTFSGFLRARISVQLHCLSHLFIAKKMIVAPHSLVNFSPYVCGRLIIRNFLRKKILLILARPIDIIVCKGFIGTFPLILTQLAKRS